MHGPSGDRTACPEGGQRDDDVPVAELARPQHPLATGTASRVVALTAAALAAPGLAAAVDLVLDAAVAELWAQSIRVELARPVEGFTSAARGPGALGAPSRWHERAHPLTGPADDEQDDERDDERDRGGEVTGHLLVGLTPGRGAAGAAADEEVVGALAALLGVLVRTAVVRERAQQPAAWAAALEEVRRGALDGAAPERVVADLVGRLPALARAQAAFVVVGPGAARDVGLGPGAQAGTGPVELGGPAVTAPVLAALRTAHGPVALDLAGVRTRSAGAGWGPAAAAPLRVTPSATGALVVVRPPGAPRFGPAVLAELEVAADVLSVLVRAATGRRDAQRLAVLTERERIAADLHRVALHRLFAVGVSLEGLLQRSPRRDQAEDLRAAVAQVDAALRDVRSAVFALPQTAAVRSAAAGRPVPARAVAGR